MRNRQTHFEQVSVDAVLEIVLRQTTAPATMLERSPAPLSGPEPPPVAVIPKLRGKNSRKGQL
jgi:hypothetical protein